MKGATGAKPDGTRAHAAAMRVCISASVVASTAVMLGRPVGATRSPALKWSSRRCAHHGGSRMGSQVGLGNRFACVWSRARYKGRCALTVGPVCRVGSAAAAPCGRAGVLNARKSVAVGVTTEPGAAIGASRNSRSGVPPRGGCQLTGRGAAERPDGILARVRSV